MISDHDSLAQDLPAPTMVLDMDGTLVDSVPDLAASVNRILAVRGLAPYTDDAIKAMVGDGTLKLIERAFAGRGRALDATAHDDYLADYGAHAADATRPFPGVPETLRALRAAGWRLAVCTNKPEGPAHTLLAALGLDDLFSAVGGGDSFPTRKPDPRHLAATLAAAGGVAGRAVMVGDHRNDVAAAAGAGIPAIFAAWGYCPRESGAGAAAVAERFADLPAIAARLIG